MEKINEKGLGERTPGPNSFVDIEGELNPKPYHDTKAKNALG
jgi:hypothetical protein